MLAYDLETRGLRDRVAMSDARISTIDRVIRRLLVALIALGASWVLRPLTFPTALEREIHAAAWSLAGHEYNAAWLAANRISARLSQKRQGFQAIAFERRTNVAFL